MRSQEVFVHWSHEYLVPYQPDFKVTTHQSVTSQIFFSMRMQKHWCLGGFFLFFFLSANNFSVQISNILLFQKVWWGDFVFMHQSLEWPVDVIKLFPSFEFSSGLIKYIYLPIYLAIHPHVLLKWSITSVRYCTLLSACRSNCIPFPGPEAALPESGPYWGCCGVVALVPYHGWSHAGSPLQQQSGADTRDCCKLCPSRQQPARPEPREHRHPWVPHQDRDGRHSVSGNSSGWWDGSCRSSAHWGSPHGLEEDDWVHLQK